MFGTFTFYAQTVPGIEKIAWRELESKLDNPILVKLTQIRDQNGLLCFEYRGDPKQLLNLRSTEDIFYLVGYAENIPLDWRGPRAIENLILRSRQLDAGLSIYKKVRGVSKKRITFRVIARKQGEHRYRRIDAQKAVEKGIRQRYGSHWKLVEDEADLEIWLTLLHHEAFFGLRLSTRTMRHRTYKIQHLPASLRPTVAYAMVFLSDPQSDDVFLDPMCGAGTILIERATAGRYRLILGGDSDPRAVETTLRNIGPKYKPIDIRQWDATDLPLEDASVDKVVSNLPFGKQIGTQKSNQRLYPAFFREMIRVVRSGGKLVVLTGEKRLMKNILQSSQELLLEKTFDISLLGTPARMYVINRV